MWIYGMRQKMNYLLLKNSIDNDQLCIGVHRLSNCVLKKFCSPKSRDVLLGFEKKKKFKEAFEI